MLAPARGQQAERERERGLHLVLCVCERESERELLCGGSGIRVQADV